MPALTCSLVLAVLLIAGPSAPVWAALAGIMAAGIGWAARP
jgi:hypothetical protein